MKKLSLKSMALGLLATTALLGAACNDAAVTTPEAPAAVHSEASNYSKGPALWLVQDDDTKVYLFGTVHVLPPELEWKTENFTSALLASDAVFLEADVSPEAEQALQAVVMDLGLYKDGRTLSDALNDEQEALLETAGAAIGMPAAALDPMEPWFASIMLGAVTLMQSGYSPESGVETQLLGIVEQSGTPLRYFETAEQQLSIFDNLPEEVQVNFLTESLESLGTMKEDMDQMVNDWSMGDVAAVAKLVNEDLSDPLLTKALLTDRNANWVVTLDKLMDDEAGTFFVAVGAGHLAGTDSVITMLEDKGMTVARQ